MEPLELKLNRDPELGPIVSHVEPGPQGRVYQFRDNATAGMLHYRWAFTFAPSIFGPWREIHANLFPGVREMLDAASKGDAS